jgi:dihydroorotase
VTSVAWVRGAARILDPAAGIDATGDLWTTEGRIGGLGSPPPELRVRAREIDASGCLVTPMFVELHAHLREPGGEDSETIASGAASALAGGYRTVFAMPNTVPPCDEPSAVRALLDRASRAGPCEVVPVSALSRGLAGRRLVDLDAMLAAGAGAFSDDGAWLADPGLAEAAFRWAVERDQLVMQHCEDFAITGAGLLHDAEASRRIGVPGIPREAEDRAVRRDAELALRLGTRLHVCHLSTRGAVEVLRESRRRGSAVTGEAAPHHLLLTVEDAVRGGPDFKMKPPLRDEGDRDALLEALADGTIGAVATDHAPHADARKCAGLASAPFGAIGMETAFASLYTLAVLPGRLPLGRLVEALTSGPAAIAKRKTPTLAAGAPAALNLIDIVAARGVERTRLASRSRNCPFHGMSLVGWPRASLLGDRLLLHRAAAPP